MNDWDRQIVADLEASIARREAAIAGKADSEMVRLPIGDSRPERVADIKREIELAGREIARIKAEAGEPATLYGLGDDDGRDLDAETEYWLMVREDGASSILDTFHGATLADAQAHWAGCIPAGGYIVRQYQAGQKWPVEFPDFDAMPAVPADWSDESWHNDICPCFKAGERDGRSLWVWIDYADAAKREFPESVRFTAEIRGEEHSEALESVYAGDDWAELLAEVRYCRLREGMELSPDDAATLAEENESADRPCPDFAEFIATQRGGNIAPICRAYRDGFLDSFQARALLAWASDKRWRMFDLRWRVCGGSMELYREMTK